MADLSGKGLLFGMTSFVVQTLGVFLFFGAIELMRLAD